MLDDESMLGPPICVLNRDRRDFDKPTNIQKATSKSKDSIAHRKPSPVVLSDRCSLFMMARSRDVDRRSVGHTVTMRAECGAYLCDWIHLRRSHDFHYKLLPGHVAVCSYRGAETYQVFYRAQVSMRKGEGEVVESGGRKQQATHFGTATLGPDK